MTPWWRWPEDKRRGLVPWFVILWRCLWLPLGLVGMCLCWLSIAGATGIQDANHWWRHQ